MSNMQIIDFVPGHIKELTELFHLAVHSIPDSVYTLEQKRAWSPEPVEYEKWEHRLRSVPPFIALEGRTPVGFLSLEPDGHIDMLYVHPAFQRQGVASAMYVEAESRAIVNGNTRLFTEASSAARPFFEARGFTVVQKNQIEKMDQILINYSMEKSLGMLPGS